MHGLQITEESKREKDPSVPLFRFIKEALGASWGAKAQDAKAQDAKARARDARSRARREARISLREERSMLRSVLREKRKSKKRELQRMRKEIQPEKERAEKVELKKKKKTIQQEIYRLERELDALGEKERAKVEEPQTGALPDFLIIGAKKCGTTSLYHLLTQHSYVEPAAAKELHFFDTHFHMGVEWYRRCFPAPRWKDGRKTITGEATPGYLSRRSVPKRIAEVIPQVRLIALLRNPVDRAYSDYQQVARKGLETLTLEEAIDRANRGDAPRNYLSASIYVNRLKWWSTFFSKEQMLVLKSEDFFERPQQTLKAVLTFLELPDWEPRAWEIRKKGRYEQGMDPSTRRRLEEYFEPHNQRLYDYLGVDFGW
jgi:hypothetical protein